MSLVFNDTANYRGLVQVYEKELGFPRGTISSDNDKLKEFAADVNLALDDFIALAIKASGRWRFDDSNQTDYPVIMTNLVSGQRDYSFLTDADGNLILDIYKVFVVDSSGTNNFIEMNPIDPAERRESWQSNGTTPFTNGQNQTGQPTGYDKMGNGIIFDFIPNYSATNGIKVYINREGVYFVFSDTNKKPGVPGLFHRYFALKPAQDYARRNNLAVLAGIQNEVQKMEGDPRNGIVGTISQYFASRTRDERSAFIVGRDSNK